MKSFKLIVTITILMHVSLSSYCQSSKNGATFIGCLQKQDYERAWTLLSASLKKSLSKEKLAGLNASVSAQLGVIKSFDPQPAKSAPHTDFYIVNFKNATLVMKIMSDDSAKIGGFYIVPMATLYTKPAYDNEEKYIVENVSVKSLGLKIAAIVTKPRSAVPRRYPAMVFLGGSGPTDADETIGCEKPFKDLSIGMALNGVLSIRFDKRTTTTLHDVKKITLQDEYLIDTRSIINYLKGIPEVDTTQIYIVGHSMGGMIAPLVLKMNPELKGAVLLAANARPIEDLVYEQLAHLKRTDNAVTDSQVQMALTDKNKIKAITTKDTAALYLGVPGYYWLSLKEVDPIGNARLLRGRRFLVIQGGNDYQVTKTDYNKWKENFGTAKNFRFFWVENLNHSLTEGKGTFSPDEYNVPENVPYSLVKTIINWIVKRA